jgi:hypothetical protein
MSWVENGVKANMREVEKGYEIIELQNLDEIMKIIHDDDYPPAA